MTYVSTKTIRFFQDNGTDLKNLWILLHQFFDLFFSFDVFGRANLFGDTMKTTLGRHLLHGHRISHRFNKTIKLSVN